FSSGMRPAWDYGSQSQAMVVNTYGLYGSHHLAETAHSQEACFNRNNYPVARPKGRHSENSQAGRAIYDHFVPISVCPLQAAKQQFVDDGACESLPCSHKLRP